MTGANFSVTRRDSLPLSRPSFSNCVSGNDCASEPASTLNALIGRNSVECGLFIPLPDDPAEVGLTWRDDTRPWC